MCSPFAVTLDLYIAGLARNPFRPLIIFLLIPVLGCSLFSPSKEEQLQRVAKDWSTTIRASQVVPVYPLTEDLQPGDVFAVQTSIRDQHTIYQKKGFLPLNNQVTRLQSDTIKQGFKEYYSDLYWKSTYQNLPHDRVGSFSDGPGRPVRAPRVSFPNYTFTVNRSGGLNVAIPIQGVPAALGLMGAQRASGTVALKDAATYGVSAAKMYEAIEEWFEQEGKKARKVLGEVTKSTEEPVYLRVITRVYLVGAVEVTLNNLESVSGEVKAGADTSMKLPDLSSSDPEQVKAAATAYQQALDTLSTQLDSPAGGSVQFTQVSRSTVSMNQDFDRLLAVGYRGFDVKVFPNGTLSAPIPSFSVLNDEADRIQFKRRVGFLAREEEYMDLRDTIKNHAKADPIRKRILAEIDPRWKTIYENQKTGDSEEEKEKQAHRTFLWLLGGYLGEDRKRGDRMEEVIAIMNETLNEYGGSDNE